MPMHQPRAWAGLRALTFLVLAVSLAAGGVAIVLPTGAFAQSGAIRTIQVEGNRRLEPETIRSYLQFNVGDAYDAAKVDRSLKALYATGLFADVRIDRTSTGVLVTVVENPVVAQVAFEGNREVDTETLKTEVQLKPRAVYTRARALADVQRILDVYRRQGRYAASVEPKLIELEQNRVNVVFEINEGNATKVKSINFVGNRAFSDSQLRDIISTTQSGWFDFLKGTNVYDPDRFALDRELLRQYYLKNGYADMRVVSATAELDRDGSGFILTFAVDEGELYKFGDVRIESSLPGLDVDGLRSSVLTKSGDYFNGADIDKTTETLTLLAAERGFAFARVRPDTNRDPAQRLINVVYVIDEGPRIYIERIDIVGNTRTKDYVIRREFRLAEGDAFNPFLVDKAKKRLQALGFFKTVDIVRRPGSAPDRVALTVNLVEQPTGELSFGAGYSTSEGVIGDVSFTERNLFGNGQFLRLKVGGSTERFQVDLSFTEPRFLDRNLSAGFDLFFKDVDQMRQSSFKSRKHGGSVRLGFPLSENLWLNTSYTLSYDDIYEVDTQTASRAVREAQGAALTSALGGSIVYDTRNHPRQPNRGVFLQLASDFAGVGGDVQYVRVLGEGRAYYPISDKITFVGRAIAGHIEGWGGDDVRLLDLFYKGGETIRGFGRSGIGPRDLNTNDALGGKTFWSATAEVRFPLPFIPDDLGMQGAVFADAASLFDAGDTVVKIPKGCTWGDHDHVCLADDSTIRTSVGASLLWNSPLGPLRLDYAYALNKADYDKIQQFRFGASTQF
jgi:outer membrane protein insertion porin family